MPKVSIPLNRNKTARRPRRAVWNLIFSLIFLTAGFVFINFLFTRDTLANSAPDHNTEFYLNITKHTFPIILDHLGQIPLIPDRAITLGNMSAYLNGDLAVYISDSERFVVFKGDLAEDTVISLANYGLLVEKDKNNWLIYSPDSEINHNGSTKNNQFQIKPKISNSGLLFNLEQTDDKQDPGLIKQEDTALYLEIPESTLSNNLVQGLSSGANIHISQIEQNKVDISIQINKALTKNDSLNLHNQLSARIYPELKTKELDDGTKLKELVSSSENVQTTELGNSTVYSTQNLTTTIDSEKTTISLQKDLISSYNTTPITSCIDNPIFYINPDQLLWFIQDPSQTHLENTDILHMLSTFVQIGLDKKDNNLQFHGCFH
jgi:hypothetical protein